MRSLGIFSEQEMEQVTGLFARHGINYHLHSEMQGGLALALFEILVSDADWQRAAELWEFEPEPTVRVASSAVARDSQRYLEWAIIGALAIFALFLLRSAFSDPETSNRSMQFPARSLVRHFESSLEVSSALHKRSGVEKALLGWFGYGAISTESIHQAIVNYENFLSDPFDAAYSQHHLPLLQARLFILYAEAGNGYRVREMAPDVERFFPGLVGMLAVAYGYEDLRQTAGEEFDLDKIALEPGGNGAPHWVEDQIRLKYAKATGATDAYRKARIEIFLHRFDKLSSQYPAVMLSGFILLGSVGAILLWMLGGALPFNLHVASKEWGIMLPAFMLALSLVTGMDAVALVVFVSVIYYYRKEVGLTFGQLTSSDVLVAFAFGYLALQVASYCLSFLAYFYPQSSSWSDSVFETLIWGSRLEVSWMFCLIVVLGPLVEEFVYRGFLQPVVKRRLGAVGAILFTSFIFAAFHNYSLVGFLVIFSLGAICAVTYEKTGSLWSAYFIHLANNLIWFAFYMGAH